MDNPDSDEDSRISKSGNTSIGFLQQISFENENLTVEEELLKAFKTLLDWKYKLEQLCIRMEKRTIQIMVLESYSKTLELFESMGGYTYQSEMETFITKFGFFLGDLKRPIKSFFGWSENEAGIYSIAVK